jgi:hypothetical protein
MAIESNFGQVISIAPIIIVDNSLLSANIQTSIFKQIDHREEMITVNVLTIFQIVEESWNWRRPITARTHGFATAAIFR